MALKFFVKTFGCQANEADSERLAAVLEKQDYQAAQKISDADVVLINTCSVRESAENRVFGLVNNLAKNRKKGQKIILTGCMVGSAMGERKRYSMRQLKLKLPQVDEFKTVEAIIGSQKVAPKRKFKNSALVPIMEGCNHFCSYCVVPYARGKEVSRPLNEIVCEIESLVKKGYREVILLGQNVNSYQPSFAQLLHRVHQIKGIKKISYMTSNPWDLSDEIIQAIALPKVDRYLHLPVQSGDGQILKKMNRPYSAADYLKLVEKIRGKIPDIQIGTDIIVGFPGETKKAFENTVDLCKKVGFAKAYISRYSPRPGTTAAKLKDNVSPNEKRRRWRVLDELINQGKPPDE
jgi:tRNA-2-methylthio-N6-dimethylallyladenosine synthase